MRNVVRLGLVVGAVLLALAVGEVAVRVLVPTYEPRQGFPATIPTGGEPVFWLKPGTSFEHVWDGDPYGVLPEGARMTVRIDRDGYRDTGKQIGRADVAVVGDSFTFGEGVEVAERFTEVFAAGIVEGGGRPISVLNAGVPGYSIIDVAAVTKSVVSRHRPRVLLAVLQPNDLVSVGEAQRHTAGDLLVHRTLGGRSRLLDLLSGQVGRRATEEWYLSYWNGAERTRWLASRGLLVKMRDRAAAEGGRFAVAMFPLLHRLDAYPFAPAHQLVAQACREAGIPFLDLHRAFLGHDAQDLWVHPTDHHPNGRAHKIAGEALAPFIRELL